MAKFKPFEPEMPAGKRRVPPTHPGAIIKGALDALDPPVSVNQAALAIGMSRQGLSLLCTEQRGMTADSALRLAAYLGNGKTGAELFMAMQAEYDLCHARTRLRDELAKIKPANVPRNSRSVEWA